MLRYCAPKQKGTGSPCQSQRPVARLAHKFSPTYIDDIVFLISLFPIGITNNVLIVLIVSIERIFQQ